jgi:hypothetical protein
MEDNNILNFDVLCNKSVGEFTSEDLWWRGHRCLCKLKLEEKNTETLIIGIKQQYVETKARKIGRLRTESPSK